MNCCHTSFFVKLKYVQRMHLVKLTSEAWKYFLTPKPVELLRIGWVMSDTGSLLMMRRREFSNRIISHITNVFCIIIIINHFLRWRWRLLHVINIAMAMMMSTWRVELSHVHVPWRKALVLPASLAFLNCFVNQRQKTLHIYASFLSWFLCERIIIGQKGIERKTENGELAIGILYIYAGLAWWVR